MPDRLCGGMILAMRVLAVGNMYPPHHLGGYEVIWRGVMTHLAAEGHDARVLTTGYMRPADGSAAADDPYVFRELSWYWHEHAWRRMSPVRRLGLERANARVLQRHLDDFRPDLVSWWSLGGMSLSLVERVRRARIPAIFFVLDYWPDYARQRDLWTSMWSRHPAARQLADRLTGIPTRVDLASAGRWVFCSRSLAREIADLGFRLDDQAVLHPGVEDALLHAPRETAAPPWRWNLLYLGRVVALKGVATAVRALSLLPEASLTIAGEGDAEYRIELERLAHAIGVSDRVRFVGPRPREELIATYRQADAVVFPVEWPEPWGLVPLEAMAAGRPVIATGTGGSADFLNAENALLFKPGDVAGLADAVRRLAGDERLRECLRANGYATASRFTERAFNEAALAEMQALITPSTAPPRHRSAPSPQHRSPS